MNLEERIRVQFSERMANSEAPVFRDFDTYAKSLPRRVVTGPMDTVLTLYKLPFWADTQAVTMMALDFESNRKRLEGDRKFVRYATAPTASGKTASILPAFLDSAENGLSINGVQAFFSYYLYIAFDNNDDRNFYARSHTRVAYEQGAFFMLECLKMFFRDEWGEVSIQDAGSVPSRHKIKSDMKDVIMSNAPNGRCLIHIDEHRSMISHTNEEEAAEFRRGALEALAEIPMVVIVATNTKVLIEVDPAGSSKVCRYPVSVPLLNIDAMSEVLTEFDMQIPRKLLTASEAGLLSSVRFRLAQKISHMGLLALHGVVEQTEMHELRRAFQAIVHSEGDLQIRLERLLALLGLTFPGRVHPIRSKNASLLLCDIPEANWSSTIVERQVSNVLLTSNGLVTARLKTLLEMVDPSHPVYLVGADHFAATLIKHSTSLLSSSPLEAAYAWVISTQSAKDGSLSFGQKSFEIQCQNLIGGLLFLKSMREDFRERFEALEKDAIYFALEGPQSGYSQDHPLCDLFFTTAQRELVVVDITGCNDEDARCRTKLPVGTKRNRMITWIKHHKGEYNACGVSLHGVILAPLDVGVSEYHRYGQNTFQVQRGADAVLSLGGLSQLLFWFASAFRFGEVEDEDENEDFYDE